MRGRTLSNSFVILDEAKRDTDADENVLTRMGENSRMVITGDPSQIDLPFGAKSGLKDAWKSCPKLRVWKSCIFLKRMWCAAGWSPALSKPIIDATANCRPNKNATPKNPKRNKHKMKKNKMGAHDLTQGETASAVPQADAEPDSPGNDFVLDIDMRAEASTTLCRPIDDAYASFGGVAWFALRRNQFGAGR